LLAEEEADAGVGNGNGNGKGRRMQTEEEYSYNETVKQVVSFMKWDGLFELKNGSDYTLFNGLNPDPFTWKDYDLSNSLRMNKFGMLELNLNISDAVL